MAFIGKKPTNAPLTSSDVADGIITNAKLAQDIISADTALAVTPATTDELLLSDAGTLKRIDYSVIAGVTEADMWRLTANLTSSADPITSNLERVDDASFEKIGTGMSVSSGVWTFPSTGLWSVIMNIEGETSGSGQDTTMSITITPASTASVFHVYLQCPMFVDDYGGLKLYRNIDGGSYTQLTGSNHYGGSNMYVMNELEHWDAPATTDDVIYRMYVNAYGVGNIEVNQIGSVNSIAGGVITTVTEYDGSKVTIAED